MEDTTCESVIREKHTDVPGAVTIRINRPEVKNALAPETLLQLNKHLFDCHHDPEVKVVFLTGTGDAFCAGADLKQLNSRSQQDRARGGEAATELMTRIVTMPKIVIAAVNGAAAGLGNHIAICSDLCIAQANANFHFTGATKGIPSMQMGALVLPMAIGIKRAKALLLQGGRVSARRAEELGFCNAVIEPDVWFEEIRKLATEFSGRDVGTLAQNKYLMNQLVYQQIGALKLSSLAGARHLADSGQVITGRLPDEVLR
ncbi:enoyl-CoA hydratase/isomerase family protein [Allopusillimonas ginsengisoli]|uniref:enoyl-CoA hydratase/isomerase family protein n=1 Tax=Allopusillimonas ginsengisoli TaxID=453575 RepID=UPI0039C146C5